jgi:hypothetical protein
LRRRAAPHASPKPRSKPMKKLVLETVMGLSERFPNMP